MVLCNTDCVEKIVKYLDISPEQLRFCEDNITNISNLKSDEPVMYFSTLIQTLAKNSKCPTILGNDKETQALSRQWLEYTVLYINYIDGSSNTERVLKELNTILSDKTYLSGTIKTIADIVLYYTLYKTMRELSHQEKARYVHVSRWFDNLQQDEKLRQSLDLISFNLINLFL